MQDCERLREFSVAWARRRVRELAAMFRNGQPPDIALLPDIGEPLQPSPPTLRLRLRVGAGPLTKSHTVVAAGTAKATITVLAAVIGVLGDESDDRRGSIGVECRFVRLGTRRTE